MFLRILFSFLVASILFTGSCKKNDGSLTTTGSQRSDCYDFPLPTSGSGYTLQNAPKIWTGALYNPNDNNQIIYGTETTQTYGSYITKLSNTSDTFQIAHAPLGGSSWSKTGWILLNDFGGTIYKIKQNGDSLTQLNTFTSMNFNPVWSPNGKRIVFSGQYNGFGGLFIMNANGSGEETLDSINAGSNPSWSSDGLKIAYVTPNSIEYIDTATKQKFVVQTFSIGDWPGKVSWFPDSKSLVYNSRYGLYKCNIDTRQTVQLRTCCDSRIYILPSISSDGTKILVTRADSKIIPQNTQYSEYHIFTMNIDGTNEVQINLK